MRRAVGDTPKDDVVIETALRGGAAVIVSGDHDLADDERLHAYLAGKGVTVLTVREFLDALEDEAQE